MLFFFSRYRSYALIEEIVTRRNIFHDLIEVGSEWHLETLGTPASLRYDSVALKIRLDTRENACLYQIDCYIFLTLLSNSIILVKCNIHISNKTYLIRI